mgnify:CR=1 FL=1
MRHLSIFALCALLLTSCGLFRGSTDTTSTSTTDTEQEAETFQTVCNWVTDIGLVITMKDAAERLVVVEDEERDITAGYLAELNAAYNPDVSCSFFGI